ncbi:MAG: GTP pyrophosphokinase [Candidatus Peribacter riflensis]|uniref:GTP pyrophosphokinase n=1 Tax=Candidatus Peribacter riflensis TaxID=1735162 RepID=A0A0S1SS79_9BACT|nr:MAG: GTP pyrophosphokinase [Candidatus Peribacter riflensis]ALM10590.1 MAG: GTP pyrophosphokinase [Candidatus Peribacter riflensis]ALM11692.1 MAG: GTP pyrophosphokinase [Candidatus Peribacter riflensis]ALM12795.1 MAG: GTP pyrophosphokinase [Candidatus Peribacter riflensis]ALM13896.1 MAG: GTP pyrophosphokinase [Candidatus Peribacter riflensis]
MGRFLAFRDAIAFARRAHDGQKRADGRVFVSHPLAVLQFLLTAGTDLPHEAYVAGLLHDAAEDGQATIAGIRAAFGADVADAVEALTRAERPKRLSERAHEESYLARIVEVNGRLPYVLLIKMADRLHNLETSQYLAPARREALLSETATLYLPLFAREEARQTRHADAYRLLLTMLEESVARLMEEAH